MQIMWHISIILAVLTGKSNIVFDITVGSKTAEMTFVLKLEVNLFNPTDTNEQSLTN